MTLAFVPFRNYSGGLPVSPGLASTAPPLLPMFNTIRKNHQFLMTIVVVVVIVCFVWLYNPLSKTNQIGNNDVAVVNGRVIQRAEIDRLLRGYQLALNLSLTDFVRDLGGLGPNEEASLSEFIINLLVVQHQAPQLGIRASDEQVVEAIKSLALFQVEGVFDPAKYSSFVQERLGPLGLTERDLEDLVRDSLSVKSLRRIVVSPVAVGEGEVRWAARIYQPVNAEVIRFDREKFNQGVEVTPGEVSEFYEKAKGGLKKGEARSVAYVVFTLPASQQKLVGKDRTNALQKLADDAVTAGKSLREGVAQGLDFLKLAATSSLQAKSIPSLGRDGTQDGKDSGLPQAVVEGAFRLQKSGDVTDIIQDGDSFYIVTVQNIAPPRQLELAEIASKITALLKSQKASKAADEAAQKSLTQIRAALAAGKSFDAAVKNAGLTAEPLKGIVPEDPKNTEEVQEFASATLGLKEGELSPLQDDRSGAFAVYLAQREPLPQDQWKSHSSELSKKLLSSDQDLLFQEWLNQARFVAKIQMLGHKSGS